MENILAQTWLSSSTNRSATEGLAGVPYTYTSMCTSTSSMDTFDSNHKYKCPTSFTELSSSPEMNYNMTLREMILNVHTNDVLEYEVIMNRIWPPLITVICALIIKRFIPTVAVAVTVAICWLVVFLTGSFEKLKSEGAAREWSTVIIVIVIFIS